MLITINNYCVGCTCMLYVDIVCTNYILITINNYSLQLCWVLYVDIVCTSIDGLPLDCALLGIVAALRNGEYVILHNTMYTLYTNISYTTHTLTFHIHTLYT